jgi:hypothetical protein
MTSGNKYVDPGIIRSRIAVVRFVARTLALLGFLFVLTFLFAEGLPAFTGEPYNVQVELIGAAMMVAGLLIGFLWELTGAALIVAGWLVFVAAGAGWPPLPFTSFLVLAALYAYCGGAAHRLEHARNQKRL